MAGRCRCRRSRCVPRERAGRPGAGGPGGRSCRRLRLVARRRSLAGADGGCVACGGALLSARPALVRRDGDRARLRVPRSLLLRRELRSIRDRSVQRSASDLVLRPYRCGGHASLDSLHDALDPGAATSLEPQGVRHARGAPRCLGCGAVALLHAVGRQAAPLHPAHAGSARRPDRPCADPGDAGRCNKNRPAPLRRWRGCGGYRRCADRSVRLVRACSSDSAAGCGGWWGRRRYRDGRRHRGHGHALGRMEVPLPSGRAGCDRGCGGSHRRGNPHHGAGGTGTRSGRADGLPRGGSTTGGRTVRALPRLRSEPGLLRRYATHRTREP